MASQTDTSHGTHRRCPTGHRRFGAQVRYLRLPRSVRPSPSFTVIETVTAPFGRPRRSIGAVTRRALAGGGVFPLTLHGRARHRGALGLAQADAEAPPRHAVLRRWQNGDRGERNGDSPAGPGGRGCGGGGRCGGWCTRGAGGSGGGSSRPKTVTAPYPARCVDVASVRRGRDRARSGEPVDRADHPFGAPGGRGNSRPA